MDFLTRLPLIGPVVARVLRSRPYRVYEHFTALKSNRLAGAVTFFGFLALFPLLTVAMAVAVGTLSHARVQQLQGDIAKQLPGISNSLDLNEVAANAGTIGVVSAAVLLLSGLGWVNTMRGSIRDIWQLPEEGGNFILRKVWDCVVLVGLGLVCAVSMVASAVGSTLAQRLAGWLGLSQSGPGRYLLAVVGFLIAVAADLVLFAYLLSPFPRIGGQRRRAVLSGALIGAVGFEVLKVALASYLSKVAGRSVYGAFAVPIALLLWINFVSRLLMYCVSWTALDDPEAARERAAEQARTALAATRD
ncbi:MULTISPECIES: YihY/virulence factor BrkB family protein [Kitasatospora]|uniref:YihY/virulence factor BrkB family protein n=1 Tax=Kitasatospora cystarginea TaxID=58350 RepID=A0ABP5R8W3_9ACTN